MAIVPPRGGSPLQDWSENFDTQITATPTVFGLVAADATAFHGLVTDFAARRAIVENPTTRNKVTLAQKNDARNALIGKARSLIKLVEAHPGLTTGQREQLRINIPDTTPSTQPPPGTAPLCKIEPSGVLTIVDSTTPSRKGKPAGTRGAIITGIVQAASLPAPVSPDNLPFIAIVTRNRTALPLPPDADAKKLYVFARWFNERGELGPISAIAGTTIAA